MKSKKRKHRKLNTLGKTFFTLLFSILLFLFTSLFIKTKINALAISNQKLKKQISIIKEENAEIIVNIRGLINKDRVFSIAEAAGMSINQGNAYVLSND